MALPQAQTGGYTYADYLQWPEGERWELIDGVAWDMSPAPRRSHQKILGLLFWLIADRTDDSPCETYVAPFDVRLPDHPEGGADESVSTVVQPDISVFCDSARLDDRGALGAPTLVVEILSPSTSYKDQTDKLALYERHGVREYWLVHPTDRTVRIYRLGADGLFGKDEVFDATMAIRSAVLTDLVVDVGALFAVLG